MVLAGHSLGGVILFELLKRGHSLSCTPQAGDDSGQIIATSRDRFPPNGALVREFPLFQGNLGW